MEHLRDEVAVPLAKSLLEGLKTRFPDDLTMLVIFDASFYVGKTVDMVHHTCSDALDKLHAQYESFLTLPSRRDMQIELVVD